MARLTGLVQKKKKNPRAQAPARPDMPLYRTDPTQGLTASQAQARVDAGYANTPVDPPTKTVGQIVRSNVLTQGLFCPGGADHRRGELV